MTIAVRFSHRETDGNALWKVKLREPVSRYRKKVTHTYACAHACMHGHIHLHTLHACTHTHTHTPYPCIYICEPYTPYMCTPYPCMCTHTHTHTCNHTCLHRHTHTRTHRTHAHAHTHTHSSNSNTESLCFWGKHEFRGKCDWQSGQ